MSVPTDTEKQLEAIGGAVPYERQVARMGSVVLTNARVYGIFDEGIFGRQEKSIPLGSIDAVFYGWRRSRRLLAIACLAFVWCFVALTYALAFSRTRGGELLMVGGFPAFLGLAFLTVFLLYRPTMISVRSGGVAVGTSPPTPEKGKLFVEAVLNQLLTQRAGLDS